MNNKKSICILGGIGPQASLYMYKLLIELSVKHFGVKNNDEFPEIILYSVPIPGFISNEHEIKIALEMLKQRVIQSKNLNILCFGIACNTAHLLLEELQAVSKAPFLSMIEEVVKQVNKDKLKKVGLLATSSTIKYALYQKALKARGVDTITPSKKEQGFFEKIIRNVLEEKIIAQDQKRLLLAANSLKKRGAQGIILGCTELSLIFPKAFDIRVFDSLEILARALLRNYYK